MKTRSKEPQTARHAPVPASAPRLGLSRRVLRNEPLQAFAILFLILNGAFYNVLWGDRTLMTSARETSSILPTGAYGSERVPGPPLPRTADPGAPGWQFEPAMAFHHNELWIRHHLPIWNPYAGYGAPWAAGMLTQPFFPPAFLLSINPTPRTVSWFVVFRLLTAGFFAYLFLRYFVGHAAGLAGAIACMLTGYFLIFINIDHISTEVLIPLLFYAMERLFRDRAVKSKLIAAGAVYLSIVSGMPESTFLILLYAYAYFAWRVVSAQEFRPRFRRHLIDFIVVNLLGFALAAFLLLPFLEFLRNGLDSHRPALSGVIGGLLSVNFSYKDLLPYLLPLVTGPFYNNIFHGFSGPVAMWGSFGVSATTLALLALVGAVRSGRRFWYRVEAPLTLFFFLSVLVFLLKHYGHFTVNWVGRLPGFELILFPKYLQPLLGFAMAMLCGLGAEFVFTGRARLAHIFASPLVVVALIAAMSTGYRVQLQAGGKWDFFFYLNVIAGIAGLMLLTAAMACCLAGGTDSGMSRVRQFGRCAVVSLLAIELVGNYIYPLYYRFSQPVVARLNPYAGAPYIRFLQHRAGNHFRMFARGGVLYPNWASAFELSDVRYIYGLNWNKFFTFIQTFLAPGPLASHGDLADRFTGDGFPYTFTTWKERRFLQLSSIRYLVGSDSYLEEISPLITTILGENDARIKAENLAVMRRSFTITGETRDVLFEHPPVSGLQLSTAVPDRTPVLVFSPALDPAVFSAGGDGVEFTLELQDEHGNRKTLYRRYIDPKHNMFERRWLDERIDLSAYAGRQIRLLFSTSGGPAGDTSSDWAGWAGLQFVASGGATRASTSHTFRQVYDGEAKVFEYAEPLPRASLFYAVDLVDSPDAALARLQDPALDVWRRVVVSSDHADRDLRRALATLTGAGTGAGGRAEAAAISSYDSQRTVIKANLKQVGVLMLTDSNYPGWNAYLDGRRTPMLSANYLFRGVLVPAGAHTVEFRYEPKSYFYGGLISLCALLACAAWWFLTTQRANSLRARLGLARRA